MSELRLLGVVDPMVLAEAGVNLDPIPTTVKTPVYEPTWAEIKKGLKNQTLGSIAGVLALGEKGATRLSQAHYGPHLMQFMVFGGCIGFPLAATQTVIEGASSTSDLVVRAGYKAAELGVAITLALGVRYDTFRPNIKG